MSGSISLYLAVLKRRIAPMYSSTSSGKDQASKGQEKKSSQQLAERNAPVVARPGDAPFGDLKTIQSQYQLNREFCGFKDLSPAKNGQKVWIRGRLASVRSKGKGAFLVVRRGVFTVQALLWQAGDITKDFITYASKIPVESVVDVYGEVRKMEQPTKTTQSEVEISIINLYCVSAAEALPFQLADAQTKDMTEEEEKESKSIQVKLETRLNHRWIDLRTPANHAIFKLQSAVCTYFREFFLVNDFVEIHTPKITPGVSEGGAAVFRLDYFGREACLAQSPQLYKQMVSACSDFFRVFEIGPVFRAENSHTHRHLCEFMGLDFEMTITEHYSELLAVLGGLFTSIFQKLNANHKDELEAIRAQHPFVDLRYKPETLVIHFPDAVKMLRAAGEEMGDFDDFSTPQEKKLGRLVAEKYGVDFYIVDRYPLTARPFYTMPCADDPRYTNSYDVFLRGEEITSGAQRIHEVELLKRRASECGIPLSNITAYLESFKYGTPPHGGAGIGLERVVMLFLGLPDIRKSCLFPRDPLRLSP